MIFIQLSDMASYIRVSVVYAVSRHQIHHIDQGRTSKYLVPDMHV
jgi:hypothetical protein